jgi:transposase
MERVKSGIVLIHIFICFVRKEGVKMSVCAFSLATSKQVTDFHDAHYERHGTRDVTGRSEEK